MRISHSKKFVYISIPKTGSTSIRDAINEYSEIKIDRTYHLANLSIERASVTGFYPSSFWKVSTHMKSQELKYLWQELFPKRPNAWNNYFKFTIVRNPWARRLSQWQFIRYKAKKESILTFSGYCFDVLKQCDGKFSNFIAKSSKADQQINWIKDDCGENLLNYVGKLEEVNESFSEICNNINISNTQIPHYNKSKHKHYSKYYTPRMVDHIAKIYEDDINEFNYDFES